MLVSVNWLKDYVDVDVPVKELGDRMIMTGSNIETITEIGTGMSGVKLGRIDKIEKHPDADKLPDQHRRRRSSSGRDRR